MRFVSPMSTATDWLNDEKQGLAVDRILEAAGVVFSRDGIRGLRAYIQMILNFSKPMEISGYC